MSDKVEIVSSSGTPFYTPIEYEYSEEVKCFVPKFGKKINRYEMIQASKPSCDINYIVKRALAGDYTSLNVNTPNYADISEVPNNLNDLHNMNVQAINSFSQLDPNIRKLFNNDVDVFIEAINNGTYSNVINEALSVNNNKESEATE